MTDEPIKVFVKLDYWEIYRANVALLIRIFGISLTVLALVMAVRIALFVTGASQVPEMLLNDGAFVLGCLLLIGFAVAPLVTAKRAIKDERVQQGMTYRFSDAGVHIESAVAKADVQWAAFRYAISTRSLLRLLTTKTGSGVQILPLRCFANNSDLISVRQLVTNKVPKKRLLVL